MVEDDKDEVSIAITVSKGEGPFFQFDCIGYYYGFQIEGVATSKQSKTLFSCSDPHASTVNQLNIPRSNPGQPRLSFQDL